MKKSKSFLSAMPRRLRLQDYEFGKILGEGLQGRIRVARHIPSKNLYVVKKLKKSQLIKLKHVDHIHNELHVLTYLSDADDNQFFVKLEGFMQDDKYFYLIMEYGRHSDLYNYVYNFKAEESLSKTHIKFFAANIVLMLEIIHQKNIIYRDLKPENILISDDGYLKLTDFGFSKYCDSRTYTLCGTSEYLAPEVLLNKGYGKSADWWAFGVLLFEFFFDYTPFYDPDPMRLYNKILNQKYSFPSAIDSISKNLIRNLLVTDLSKRFGNLKNGVNDIKQHKFFEEVNWEKMLNKQYSTVIESEFFKLSLDEDKLFGYGNVDADYICNSISISEDPFLKW